MPIRLILLIIVFITLCSSLYSAPLDLTGLPAYVRKGFSQQWIKNVPDENSKGWIRLKGKKGNRSIQIFKLNIKGFVKPPLFSLRNKSDEFTILFNFQYNIDHIQMKHVGLYLAQIGENWEIYLNGTIIRSEIFLNNKGEIFRRRSLRKQLIYIPSALLQKKNILAFRIIGDSSVNRTGFFMRSGYFIDDYIELQRMSSEKIEFIFLSIYLFFGLNHIVLFLWRRKDSFNLYFGIASFCVSMFYLARSNAMTEIILDTEILKHLDLGFMILSVLFVHLFGDRLILKRLTIMSKIHSLYALIFIVVLIPFEHDFLRYWQISVVFFLIIMLIFNGIIPICKNIVRLANADARDGSLKDYVMAFFSSIVFSIPGNMMIGGSILFITILSDLYNFSHGILTNLTQYGFLIFIIGTVMILANRFHHIHDIMEMLTITLEEKVVERTKQLNIANREIETAMTELEATNDHLIGTNNSLEKSKSIMDRDMKMAVKVQEGFFPNEQPHTKDWDIAFEFKPMSGVSGDLYDFYIDDENNLQGVSLFDVSGHGIASGLITILARSIAYHEFYRLKSEKLNRIIEEINNKFIDEFGQIDNYLTGVMLKFNVNSVEYVNAGHPGILKRNYKSGKVDTVEPEDEEMKGHFLGINMMQENFSAVNFEMESKDSILLFSDCLTESKNISNEEYGLDRLMQLFSSNNSESAQDILDSIINDLLLFKGEASMEDDLTVIVVQKK